MEFLCLPAYNNCRGFRAQPIQQQGGIEHEYRYSLRRQHELSWLIAAKKKHAPPSAHTALTRGVALVIAGISRHFRRGDCLYLASGLISSGDKIAPQPLPRNRET